MNAEAERFETALARLASQIEGLKADPARVDDPYVIVTLQEALAGAREGNAAVGAALVDPGGYVAQAGHARMFHPRFRSDLHAEMDVLTAFELRAADDQTLRGYTLYSSLEPCEMCMIRIINSGVTRTRYAAPDEKAKTSRRAEWAPHWQRLAAAQEFAPADCSPALAELGWQVFALAAPRHTEKLLARR
jgi:cytosine deaminase